MSTLTRRLAIKMALLFGGFLGLFIAAFLVWSQSVARTRIEDSFGLALERIVATAALEIDGDAHKLIRTMDDVKRPEFAALRDKLRRVQQANYLEEELLYTFHIDQRPTLKAGVMLQATPYTGDPYTLHPQNREAVERAIRDKVATHTKLYRDEHDEWISAYAPIVDAQGNVEGILEADYRVTKYEAEVREELQKLAVVGACALLFAMIAVVIFARRLEGDLQRIRAGAEAIEHGDYAHRIQVSREDELGLVARQFNRMAEVLFERFHMLKFLPRHTLDAIERRAKEGQGKETERVDASIFFSDIRGYTKMSAGLSDEHVVRMLNIFLRRQAEILEEHGGTVDKYIGDAVLAVFSGPGHEEKAVGAALRIQRSVDDMNASRAFEREVRIGIGIASGSLVLAELGSEGRRERTIIGSTVNLASRLCSHAAAGEVVVSDATWTAVATKYARQREELVELKGFAGEQKCHLVVSTSQQTTAA